jgi:hypothetical protein
LNLKVAALDFSLLATVDFTIAVRILMRSSAKPATVQHTPQIEAASPAAQTFTAALDRPALRRLGGTDE